MHHLSHKVVYHDIMLMKSPHFQSVIVLLWTKRNYINMIMFHVNQHNILLCLQHNMFHMERCRWHLFPWSYCRRQIWQSWTIKNQLLPISFQFGELEQKWFDWTSCSKMYCKMYCRSCDASFYYLVWYEKNLWRTLKNVENTFSMY